MRTMHRLAVVAVLAAMLAGCATGGGPVRDAYERVVVCSTTRTDADDLFGTSPVRAGIEEIYVADPGDPYARLVYGQAPPNGAVIGKHLFAYTDSHGERTRNIHLMREGVVKPEKPDLYRDAIKSRDIDRLIDLLAPGAGTLEGVLNETPFVRPTHSKVVSVKDEAQPQAPPPPPGQRHLPDVFLYTRAGQIEDFHISHVGWGRWTLITRRGDLHSAFFIPGQIYPGSRSYQTAAVGSDGFLTFTYSFKNYAETVTTTVAVKETAPGLFESRYETLAEFVRKP